MKKAEPMRMVVSIVERGVGGKLIKLYEKQQVYAHLRCEGQGTATSEILDIFGPGGTEKDVVFSFTTRPAARALLEKLDDELRGAVPGRGIAFTLPLTAMSSLLAVYIGHKTRMEDEGGEGMDSAKNRLILVPVNRGSAEGVMATARQAGARGGTVLRGRWVGDGSFGQALGITTLQEEREILLIVVPTAIRNQVMNDINRTHGLKTEACALVTAMGIEQLIQLS